MTKIKVFVLYLAIIANFWLLKRHQAITGKHCEILRENKKNAKNVFLILTFLDTISSKDGEYFDQSGID